MVASGAGATLDFGITVPGVAIRRTGLSDVPYSFTPVRFLRLLTTSKVGKTKDRTDITD